MTGRSVIIVEDEGLIALHLMEMLSEEGFTVTDLMSSGEDLLDYLASSPLPDVILLDIGLSGEIDGIETARQVRKRYDIPVVFMSAFSDRNKIEEAREIAPSEYLIKPVMMQDLIRVLEKVLVIPEQQG